MPSSSSRVRDYNTVHHIGSRIAHKVYFLEEGERNDFIAMTRRVADFCGIQLIGWCIMANHFHLLVYLPVPAKLDEQEILRRYAQLNGQAVASAMENTLDRLRQQGDTGAMRISQWLNSQRKRMYDISIFMKILKQWFTEEYNRRHSHTGTLWEARYFDRPVLYSTKDIARCLAYIHLNPVRAAIVDSCDAYAWSSYCAFKDGDLVAVAGMRFAYGDETSVDEIVRQHEELMDGLLEDEKRNRAEEIARKMAAGYSLPCDPLTSEAMVAQASAHLEEASRALIALRAIRDADLSAKQKRAALKEEVRLAKTVHPDFDFSQLMDLLSIPRSTLYRILKELQN